MQDFNSYTKISYMDFKISFQSVLKLLWNSSSWRNSEIGSYILFINVSLHMDKNSCIRFVIVIQYEESALYTLDTMTSFLFLLESEIWGIIIASIIMYQVFLAGNAIPITISYWWCSVMFPMDSPYPFFFISSFSL